MAVQNSNCCLTTNQTAFATVTALAGTTILASIKVATTAAAVATAAYAILAITAFGLSVAAITAWVKTNAEDGDANDYFNNLTAHAGYALAATYQFVATTLVAAVVEGLSKGISNAISRKIGGADHVVEVRNR